MDVSFWQENHRGIECKSHIFQLPNEREWQLGMPFVLIFITTAIWRSSSCCPHHSLPRAAPMRKFSRTRCTRAADIFCYRVVDMCSWYFPLLRCCPCWNVHSAIDIFLTVQLTKDLLSAVMDATVNQGIQPDLLYMCGWYFLLSCCCVVILPAAMREFNWPSLWWLMLNLFVMSAKQ